MDEITVRLMRSLACHERLKLLTLLIGEKEMPPTMLARKLDILDSALSGHLAKLTAVGLIERRRSGGWMYCIAQSPYPETTLSGKVSALLSKWLKSPSHTLKNCGLHEVRNNDFSDATAQIHSLIFDAATAFTDVRRIQILRRIVTTGTADSAVICTELKMSPWAVRRHTDKLVRRGFLIQQTSPNESSYQLAEKFKSPIHTDLFQAVRGAWKKT